MSGVQWWRVLVEGMAPVVNGSLAVLYLYHTFPSSESPYIAVSAAGGNVKCLWWRLGEGRACTAAAMTLRRSSSRYYSSLGRMLAAVRPTLEY